MVYSITIWLIFLKFKPSINKLFSTTKQPNFYEFVYFALCPLLFHTALDIVQHPDLLFFLPFSNQINPVPETLSKWVISAFSIFPVQTFTIGMLTVYIVNVFWFFPIFLPENNSIWISNIISIIITIVYGGKVIKQYIQEKKQAILTAQEATTYRMKE